MRIGALAILGLVLSPGAATAQDYASEQSNIFGSDWQFTLGAGATYAPDYEGSDDYEWTFKPLARATWRDMISVGNTTWGNARDHYGVEATPFRFDTFSAGFGLAYWNGRDAGENSALTGLGDLDSAIIGSATIANRFQLFDAHATVMRDFSGNRDGTAVEAGASVPLPTSDTGVTLRAGAMATWVDENYMQNTFGVNAVQSARSGYAVHDTEAGFKDIGANLEANYDVTSQVAVTVRGEVKQLLGDAADSPIVDQQGSATQASVFGGLSYRF